MSIRIVITDDHPIATSGILSMLQPDPRFEVTGVYHSAAATLEGLKKELPDVLLLDILLPDQSGRELTPVLRTLYPCMKIIVLTSLDAPSMVSGMMRRGCNGYLLKDTGSETLAEAIISVYEGAEYIEPSLKEKLLQNLIRFQQHKNEKAVPEITQREKQILKLIAEEYTTQEIADKLFISFRTVENHRYSLLQKLYVKNVAGLVKIAIQLGLVE